MVLSLTADKGEKRLLYQVLGVTEYWIIDVQNMEVIAFGIVDGGSKRIQQSQVLPLAIGLLQEAFQRSRQMNQGQVFAWLMSLVNESVPGVETSFVQPWYFYISKSL
ncbi:Uma2 family endonuclease [Leptolyngbya sp. FACHB-261]|uniref:Uma2 family endonuclease n=1 Tax=Leptolyngbya sp. FACHB-261 TaxID=2692806 RepID=UPI0016861533|nr:Uma2 family endonuclease [Leptolyngbya sp. FACHB-261]MBD2099763.1 Uma2 family endonuclease [Leptolyngbya sp. FACHB-261]